ncbi:MAG: hypothetical protein FWC96_01150 [Oscillospiraceae bacterium]|nr:hypothetical protein [Oscillospiraceae bacterium]
MSNILANDVRTQYQKSFATIRGILDAFPEGKWFEPHGDAYYIPSRIAYHLAEFIDGAVAGGYQDPEFRNNLPFGPWKGATAETLPGKRELIAYYEEAVARANKALESIDDDSVTAPIPPGGPPISETHLGLDLYIMRELAAHTGEMNKMLIENGLEDIWM